MHDLHVSLSSTSCDEKFFRLPTPQSLALCRGGYQPQITDSGLRLAHSSQLLLAADQLVRKSAQGRGPPSTVILVPVRLIATSASYGRHVNSYPAQIMTASRAVRFVSCPVSTLSCISLHMTHCARGLHILAEMVYSISVDHLPASICM